MPTDVGHGRRRRSRRTGGKRRTRRAAITAGALAAVSIPLWPSTAGAVDYDELKYEDHTFHHPLGGDCPVRVKSSRIGERVEASTLIPSNDTRCLELVLKIEVRYSPLGSGSVKSITVSGTAGSGLELGVTADGARDLTQSKHTVGWRDPYFGGCICTDYTLNHPK